MRPAERAALSALMKQHGIQQSYRAANGRRVRAATDGVLAILRALGVDVTGDLTVVARREAERAALQPHEPVSVAWDGRLDARLRTGSWRIVLEDGETRSGSATDSFPLVPLGYHTLYLDEGAGGEGEGTLVVAAPRRCHEEAGRTWGVFAPLYAIRETENEAIGDFGDLAALMRWIGELDGGVVATLPVSAAFLRSPFEPSPYAPASRLYWNEIYLEQDVDRDTEAASAAEPFVDYRPIAEMKRARLEPEAQRFFAADGERTQRWRDFVALYPDVDDYARFRAAGERFESGWPAWPGRARAGELTASDYEQAAVHFHRYAQLLAHEQLAKLADRAGSGGAQLYLDMPLGVHPDSYDIWRNRGLFITGAAAGAPPDPFFSKGQNWGFPPPHPARLREQHYAYWRRVLQTQLRYAGILRLDHVMALYRLYIVPHGCEAADGVYIRYPVDELIAVLALESVRHGATIVGEDLGTVPAEVRRAMARHGVKRMFVVQFEAADDADPPLGPVPADAVASLNTHDMPPFRAYWEARDAELRQELGLIDDAGVAAARATRRRTASALARMLGGADPLEAGEARTRLIEWLARSPAEIVLLNLEDLWLELEPQNVPGTSQERPNWRRRLRYSLSALRADARVRDLLGAVARARRTAEGQA